MWTGGPVPPGAAAITVGRLVIIRRSAAGNERLMRHELVHVRQWRELGAMRFLVGYLGAYFQGRWRGHGHWEAYRRIPLEMEAEAEAEAAAATAALDPVAPPLETDPPPG